MEKEAVLSPIISKKTDLSDLVSIQKTMTPLSSKLKKRYLGYKVTLTNNGEYDVEVLDGSIQNGVDGQQAANTVETS